MLLSLRIIAHRFRFGYNEDDIWSPPLSPSPRPPQPIWKAKDVRTSALESPFYGGQNRFDFLLCVPLFLVLNPCVCWKFTITDSRRTCVLSGLTKSSSSSG